MIKYSKNKKVKFNEDDHSYFLGDKKLESVTSYVSRFKNIFDTDSIAEKYAKKNKLNKDTVIEQWNIKRELSAKKGTAIHKIFEHYILTNVVKLSNQYEEENIANKFIDDYFKSKKLIPLETELIVYNKELAGQVDCIAKDNKDNIYILDWKTNQKIDTESYQNKKMLGMYSHLPDCNFYHYSLQLSLYKKMIDCKIINCYIVHITEKDYKIIKTINL